MPINPIFPLPDPAPGPSKRAAERVLAAESLQDLQVRLDRLNLLLQSLLRVMIAKGVIEESEFREWITWVDQLDGRQDGKLAKESGRKECADCHRFSPGDALRCQYCGKDFEAAFLQAEKPVIN